MLRKKSRVVNDPDLKIRRATKRCFKRQLRHSESLRMNLSLSTVDIAVFVGSHVDVTFKISRHGAGLIKRYEGVL